MLIVLLVMDFMSSILKRKCSSHKLNFLSAAFTPKNCKASTSTFFFFFLFQFVQNEVRSPALFLCDKEGLGPHPVSRRRQEKGGTVLLTRYEYVTHLMNFTHMGSMCKVNDCKSVDV